MKGWRKASFRTGIVLLVVAALMFVALLAGFDWPAPANTDGLQADPGLRMIARIAVAGCALAAVGSWELD